jgi:hypothetical protein
MERMAWTDERLEERFNGIDRRFDGVERELLELRREMHAGFAGLHSTISRVSIGIMLSSVSLIAAVLAKGV